MQFGAVPVEAVPERFCKDCKYFDDADRLGVCHALDGQPSPVSGKTMAHGIQADTMRMTLCGWLPANLWERK
jgi:hypothetical protein